MRFTPLLAAFIYALPVLAKRRDDDGDADHNDDGEPSSTVPVISTSPIETLPVSPTVHTPSAPIASGSVITLTPTPTSSSNPMTPSGAPPTPTNVFQFARPDNVTICHASTFIWSYVSAIQMDMTLVVTNEENILPPELASQNTELVSRTLTNTISSESGLYVWQSANVPIGPYVVVAFNTDALKNGTVIAARSLPFFVRPGLDESCLNGTAEGSTGAGSAPASETSPSGSTSSEELSAKKSMSPGAIAGTVVGVVGGIILLAIAILFPRYWTKRNERHRRHEGGPYNLF